MKQIIYILIILGICSCKNKTKHANEIPHIDSVQTIGPIAQLKDTLPPIPKEIIQREYLKSLNVHSYHSMFKKEFAFNDWLTEVYDSNIIQKKNSYIDSLLSKVNNKRDTTLNLSDEWHLKFLIMKGWYEIHLDKTNVNKCYVSKANKFRLRGADLKKIFKKTEGWAGFKPNENELIFLYGHWYPNGNQTSWEYNHFYYFSK